MPRKDILQEQTRPWLRAGQHNALGTQRLCLYTNIRNTVSHRTQGPKLTELPGFLQLTRSVKNNRSLACCPNPNQLIMYSSSKRIQAPAGLIVPSRPVPPPHLPDVVERAGDGDQRHDHNGNCIVVIFICAPEDHAEQLENVERIEDLWGGRREKNRK